MLLLGGSDTETYTRQNGAVMINHWLRTLEVLACRTHTSIAYPTSFRLLIYIETKQVRVVFGYLGIS